MAYYGGFLKFYSVCALETIEKCLVCTLIRTFALICHLSCLLSVMQNPRQRNTRLSIDNNTKRYDAHKIDLD